jgi:hypothetical protein
MVDILKQLRQFTAPFPQKVNGDKLDDVVILCGRRHPPACFQIGFTEQEWLEDLSETLRAGLSVQNDTKDEELIEKKLQEIKDNFPSGSPYTLTHGDLNLTNIIVEDDKIQAIIDWELSGYFPWWAERYIARLYGDEDMDDLFEGVWERVHPDLADDAIQVIFQKVRPVRLAFANAQVWHDDQRHGFYRPPFCKCRPHGGIIQSHTLGMKAVHTVDDWRNDCEPYTYDWYLTVREPRRSKEMEQNTPTPTPSAASARWFEKVDLSGQEK